MRHSSLRGALAAVLSLCVGAPVLAQKSTADGIAEYREMLQDGNPAELFEAKGEDLWKQKRGPRKASLERCDLGKGPGVVKGAFVELPRYFADTGTGLAELRGAFLSERGSAMQQVLDRAVARGEADPAKLTPRVVAVPFDLFRQELLMTLKAVPDEVAEGIVDEVFLPLVLTRPAGRG